LKIGINATFLSEKPTGLGVFTQEISRYISVLNKDFVLFSPFAVEGVSENSIYEVPPSVRGSLRFRDNLLRLLRLVPYRCDACGKRFYAREPRKKH